MIRPRFACGTTRPAGSHRGSVARPLQPRGGGASPRPGACRGYESGRAPCRSGSFKTSILDAEGREQIVGFHIKGDAIGLDSAFMPTYLSTTQALEETQVCSISLLDIWN